MADDTRNPAMKQQIERQLALPRVSVVLATVHWGAVEEVRPQFAGYNLCQRLSADHAPLRIGNLAAREAFPRVRSVAFLPPGCPVKLYPLSAPMRVLNCVFEPQWFETTTGIGPDLWDRHAKGLIEIRNRRLEVLMQEILAELEQPGFGHELLVESAAAMILVELARYASNLDAEQASGQGLAPWQLRRIQERIAGSLEAGYPALPELAQLCGISLSHLMRTFKASTGWPIHKYIAEERLRAAKDLLAGGKLDAKEISARLGFRNPAYFATAFRRMTGKTPTEFRREAQAARA
jgi:AraC family transcriptional regulator